MSWSFRTWLVWAEQFGLGELALLPDQFWRLTPREFDLLHAGFQRREDRAWEKIATLGLWVLAPHSKKQLTPAELLGRRLQTAPPTGTEAKDDAEFQRAKALADALKWATK